MAVTRGRGILTTIDPIQEGNAVPLQLTDHARSRLDAQITHVARDLANRYPSLPEEQLRTWADEERDQLLAGARFADFVPVLVRSRLNQRVHSFARTGGHDDEASPR